MSKLNLSHPFCFRYDKFITGMSLFRSERLSSLKNRDDFRKTCIAMDRKFSFDLKHERKQLRFSRPLVDRYSDVIHYKRVSSNNKPKNYVRSSIFLKVSKTPICKSHVSLFNLSFRR